MNSGIEILYEDNHVIVAVKPPNMLSQGDITGDRSILDELKEYVRVKYNKAGEAYLGLVHRLDRPVGGLMVFARTSKAAARLSLELREHRLGREYLAVVEGETPEKFLFEDELIKDEKTNIVRVAQGGKAAQLSGETIAVQNGLSLVYIKLGTGRGHQIRVQLAHHGYPLVGDARYGLGGTGIALFGAVLRFTHPVKKEVLVFSASPKAPAFDGFREAVQSFLKGVRDGKAVSL
ncbi:MAG: RluA family pseudouridine synthase [Eubacteriales bacterium]|nr:RluA family pseudouridine synthase [Eubacteriales bacterium]MDD3880848.1 RluA family pseudouridine synthase [Eubacteriales bacterium]MDD4511785.1 RluA family pseudouridine synthase [Eubacteriales bacterium]